MNHNKFYQSQYLITGRWIHMCIPVCRPISMQAKRSESWYLPPPAMNTPCNPPLWYCCLPAELCRLWEATGTAEGRRHREHPPRGSFWLPACRGTGQWMKLHHGWGKSSSGISWLLKLGNNLSPTQVLFHLG